MDTESEREERGERMAVGVAIPGAHALLSLWSLCVCEVHWFSSTTSTCLLLHLLPLVLSFAFAIRV